MPFPYSNPEINESINRLDYTWQDMGLVITADRITDSGTAELWFYHLNGNGKSLLHTAKANLLSTTTMNQLTRRMLDNSVDIPWQQVLTFVVSRTMEYQRRGEEPVIIQPANADQHQPVYLIYPLLMKGVPNIVYGDKGVNKTTIALAALGILACGSIDSPSGLGARVETKVGILDWESNADLTTYTLARLVDSGTIPYCEIPYLRCKTNLPDEIDRIANFIKKHDIQVILIDSLGQAAGSDKFDSAGKGTALRFFECLRLLNVTSLIIAQNAKGDSNVKTIYGSTYFTYYSRNIFELRRARDTSRDDDMHVALIHQEGNYSKKFQPIGFHLTYADKSILIEAEEVNLAQLRDRIEDTEAILDFLRIERRLCTVKSISEAIDKPENRTRVVLSLLKKRSKLVNPGTGLWGLAADD